MIHTQVFRYRCINGQPTLVDENEGNGTPPEELPDWQCSDDRGIAVIYISQDDGCPVDAAIEIATSPAIIKGWKIYQMHTTRLTDGGMINDRQMALAIKQLQPHERRRIDILLKGPPGRVQVSATPR
jgi:hypothetical protein